MKRTILMFIISALVVASLALWVLKGHVAGNTREMIMVGTALVIVGFAIFLGIDVDGVEKNLGDGVEGHKPYGEFPVSSCKLVPDDDHGDAPGQAYENAADHIFRIIVKKDNG